MRVSGRPRRFITVAPFLVSSPLRRYRSPPRTPAPGCTRHGGCGASLVWLRPCCQRLKAPVRHSANGRAFRRDARVQGGDVPRLVAVRGNCRGFAPRTRRSTLLEVRIGIIQTAKELDVELAEGTRSGGRWLTRTIEDRSSHPLARRALADRQAWPSGHGRAGRPRSPTWRSALRATTAGWALGLPSERYPCAMKGSPGRKHGNVPRRRTPPT